MHSRCVLAFGSKILLTFILSCATCHWATAEDKVFISEFMAVNERTLADEDGEYSDWIEIHNAGTNLVNLNGWYLTDKSSQLTEWRFPSTDLAPNAVPDCLRFRQGPPRRRRRVAY